MEKTKIKLFNAHLVCHEPDCCFEKTVAVDAIELGYKNFWCDRCHKAMFVKATYELKNEV